MVAFQKSLLRDCTRWRCPRLVSPERLPRVLAALRTATGVQAAAVDKALRLKNAELADNVYSGVPAHEFGLEQIIEVGLRDIHSLAPFLGFTPFRVIGALLIAAAIPVLLESFGRFALQGIGPPAPVFPTRNLVLRPKSYVRRSRIVDFGSSPASR